MDVESDRLHPTKRNRPIASGVVPMTVAYPLAVVLIGGALALGFVTGSQSRHHVARYLALTLSYSIRLKQVPILDIIASAGFVLRAFAGGAATGVPISEWFFIVASFGALFMVSGKRESEAAELGIDAAGCARRSASIRAASSRTCEPSHRASCWSGTACGRSRPPTSTRTSASGISCRSFPLPSRYFVTLC